MNIILNLRKLTFVIKLMKYKTVIVHHFKDYPLNSCIGDGVWLNCGLHFLFILIYNMLVWWLNVEKDDVNQTISYDSLACKNSFSTPAHLLLWANQSERTWRGFKETGAKTAAALDDNEKTDVFIEH